VLTRGDLITNTTRYLHVTEATRPDVRVLDQEMLTLPWMTAHARRTIPDVTLPGDRYDVGSAGGYSLRQLMEANPARPFVVCGGIKSGDTSLSGPEFSLWPLGICDLVRAAGAAPAVGDWLAASGRALPVFRNDVSRVPADGSWERVAWQDYWEARHRRAFTLLTYAIARGDEPDSLRESAALLDALAREHPLPPAYVFKNLGIAHARLASADPASRRLAVEAWQRYLAVAPPGDADVPAIRDAISALSR
jgi:hypothetical protein